MTTLRTRSMLRASGLALAACVGSGLMLGQMVGQASAMPANGLTAPAASAKQTAGVQDVRQDVHQDVRQDVRQDVGQDVRQDVRYVCGPYRCWWRPGPYWGPRYGYYAYGPGPYWHRPWGWHRWGWRRWGWHRHWA